MATSPANGALNNNGSNVFNWSIPPYQTPMGSLFTTQCWGPPSKLIGQTDYRSEDNAMAWGTFESRYCNLTDKVAEPVPCSMGEKYQPGITSALVSPMAGELQQKHPGYSVDAVGNYAQSFRAPLLVNRCWQNKLTSLGDGVVFDRQYQNEFGGPVQ